jgi:predicted permease
MPEQPPKIAEWLLCQFLLRKNKLAVLGDFEELYHDIREKKGTVAANLWYWFQIVRSFPGFVLNSVFWGFVMFQNYLKVTLRNIRRHKGFSFINIAGLALGVACCLLISLWVLDELSYDRFHDYSERLYRVEADQDYSGRIIHAISTPVLLSAALEEELPEVLFATRFTRFGGLQLTYEETSFFEQDVRSTDPSFFQMFSFPLLKGDPLSALENPFSIILSERMAAKYFGDEDPLGKVITAENKFEMTITGVIENPPDNSTLQYDWIVPFEFVFQNLRRMPEGWSDAISNFVLLKEGSSLSEVNRKINELIRKHRGKETKTDYSLFPLKRMRLFAVMGEGEIVGNIRYVYIFSIIALLVLLIACINFMNLSTARSAVRAREVGMRKVVGAQRGHIIRQFFGESLLYTGFSLISALLLTAVLLPVFNQLTGKNLSLSILITGPVLAVVVGITVFAGLVSGSYPALLLSSFRPVRILSSSLGTKPRSSFFRKTLVVIQFSLSVFLIIGAGVVYNQVRFMQGMDIGYNKEHVLLLPMRGDVGKFFPALRAELQRNPQLLGVTAMSRRPNNIRDYARDATWEGKEQDSDVRVNFAAVSYDFPETMGLEMVEGRAFSRDFPTDAKEAFVVNEELAKLIGRETAVGTGFSMFGRKGRVVGVLKNFHFQPLRVQIQPLVLLLAPNPYWLGNIVIRLSPGDMAASLDLIEKTWKRVVPGYPFEYEFLDEEFDLYYWRERRMGSLLGYFSFLAVFIACLGLFGLASFTAEQRTKEIGIRKVLGASVSSITLSLCREFALLVTAANLIAWPLIYLVSRDWLNNFAYRFEMGPFLFILAGLLALTIALLTVSYQAVRAARANPVEALKYE